MSFTTASGLFVTDAQIRAYFSGHPDYLTVARQAASLGLDATEIANALKVGMGLTVTPDAVRGWVAAHASEIEGWTLRLAPPASSTFQFTDAPGVQVLDIISTSTSAQHSAVTNTLTVSTTAYTTLEISGDAALDLSPGWAVALMSVTTVAAADFDAGLHVYLYGNTHDLDIAVGDGADIVVAGFGNDHIVAGGGDDIIFAGRAADVVDAGSGNDWIRGGPARDVMTGGPGVDTFAYVFDYESSADTGIDLITDFKAGTGGDILDFHDLTHGAGQFAGNASGAAAVHAALAAGSVRAVMDTASGTLYVDVDANGAIDGTHDIAIQLAGVGTSLNAGNFIF